MALPNQEISGRCSRCGAELTGPAAHNICPACALADAFGDSRQTASETVLQPKEAAGSSSHTAGSVEAKSMPVSIGVIEKPGDRIGRYKLMQELGEGGMGVVWMAEQTEPVRRRVALKVIKLGMDTRQVIGRFEAERQALALMDHPNIAKVLDAGATETGRPFFVMELVKGTPITEYCDREKLSTQERLELFVQVCQAIQHAHQKGIIHRDIKPSNILVTLNDGVPVPKIIDFGIAKATGGQVLTDKTVFTAIEQFIGTPAYMSPEQAEMNAMDIDTRSDIYALGVLLYELLTGRTPFDSKVLVAKGIEEIRRVIREEEPPRPSTRLSTLDAGEQTTVARQRQSEPPKLVGMIRGDLDWIVMKTLEKDRRRRYDTANGLGMDVQRYLRNEAVVARPPSQIYRLQKLVYRNKLAFAAGACITTALLLGLIGTSWQSWRATRENRIADSERQRADQNATAERTQRERAEAAARRANEALSMSLVNEGERLTKEDADGQALAHFARAVRLNPSNNVAATLIVSLLNQRDFPLPLVERPSEFSSTNRVPTPGDDLELSGDSIVDKKTRKEVSRLKLPGGLDTEKGGGHVTLSPVFSPDGKKVAFRDQAGSVQVFNTQTGEQMLTPARSAKNMGTLPRFTPDSRQVVIGHRGVAVWDVITGTPVFQSPPPLDYIFAMDISPDGRLIATAMRSRQTRIWDVMTGVPSREAIPVDSDIAAVRGVKWARKTSYLATQQNEYHTGKSVARYWDVRPGRAAPMTCWSKAAVVWAAYDPTSSMLGVVSDDGKARVWRTESASLKCQPSLPEGEVVRMAFSPDASRLALGSQDGRVGVWDLKADRLLWNQSAHSNIVSALEFTADGKLLVSGEGDRLAWNGGTRCDVRVFESSSGRCYGEITNHLGSVLSLAVCPDGARIAVTYKDYVAEVWDLSPMQRLGEPLTRGQGWVWHSAFSHDGKWLVTSSGGDAAQLWDARSPKNQPLQSFPHDHGVLISCFSPDDQRLLTCSEDGTARVWDRATGTAITQPLRHTRRVAAGCFSPDGREVLTGSEDGTTMAWDVITGHPLSVAFRQYVGKVFVSFSPDGSHILVAGSDRAARVYPWLTVREPPPGWLPDLAEAVSGYRLNEAHITEHVPDAGLRLARLRQTLQADSESVPLARWAQWYLADRSTRTINFRSRTKVQEYARALTDEDNQAALDEALDFDPENALAYVKLASNIEAIRPETAGLYRQIARDLGAGEDLLSSNTNRASSGLAGSPADPDDCLDAKDGLLLMQRVDKTVKAKGTIVTFATARSGTFHFLNFSKNYRSALTLAFQIDANPGEFRPETLREYVNKTVVVEGKVKEYLGGPEMLMRSLSQIKIVGSAPGDPP
ncbi:MAG: hypothetical protein C5B50_15910 [Verrucomicrobia bacterium]|nr:MAG: hypothetical protein C5B50_15910 [Verrucomicrobiota bacterium]